MSANIDANDTADEVKEEELQSHSNIVRIERQTVSTAEKLQSIPFVNQSGESYWIETI